MKNIKKMNDEKLINDMNDETMNNRKKKMKTD